jgi:hypothetical protein
MAYGVSPFLARCAIFWRISIPSFGRPILMPLAFARAIPALVAAQYTTLARRGPGLDAVPHQPVPHRPDAMLAAVGYPPLKPRYTGRAAAGRHGALCV